MKICQTAPFSYEAFKPLEIMSDVSMEVRVIAKVIEPTMQIPGCYYLQKNDKNEDNS